MRRCARNPAAPDAFPNLPHKGPCSMSASSRSLVGRLSPPPPITSAPVTASSASSRAASSPQRSRSGGPLNRLQSFSADQSTRTQTEAAVAHATPVAATTIATLGDEPGAGAQHADGAGPARLARSVDGYRALARSIDFSARPLAAQIVRLGEIVEDFAAYLKAQGMLQWVSEDQLIHHVAADLQRGGKVPADQMPVDAARAHLADTRTLGFTSGHTPGEPIFVVDGNDGQHVARHQVLHLLSAPGGRTQVKALSNALNEMLTEVATRLIERAQLSGDLEEVHACTRTDPRMADAMLRMIDTAADPDALQAGLMQACVQDRGIGAFVEPMRQSWLARSTAGEIAKPTRRASGSEESQREQLARLLVDLANGLAGKPQPGETEAFGYCRVGG
jgi:hypothetical protein